MTIEQIREIGVIVSSLGANSKEVVMWFLIYKTGIALLNTAVILSVLAVVYLLVMKSINWNNAEREIMNATGISHYIDRTDLVRILTLIEKGKEK